MTNLDGGSLRGLLRLVWLKIVPLVGEPIVAYALQDGTSDAALAAGLEKLFCRTEEIRNEPFDVGMLWARRHNAAHQIEDAVSDRAKALRIWFCARGENHSRFCLTKVAELLSSEATHDDVGIVAFAGGCRSVTLQVRMRPLLTGLAWVRPRWRANSAGRHRLAKILQTSSLRRVAYDFIPHSTGSGEPARCRTPGFRHAGLLIDSSRAT